jgi:hypothetical protein
MALVEIGKASAKKRRVRATAVIDKIPAGVSLPIKLMSPLGDERLRGFALENAKVKPMRVLHENEHAGKSLALCGAGPSLDVSKIDSDVVYACNSALPWLVDHGVAVDAGVSIDQSEQMLKEWENPPDVEYLVASTVDPRLVQQLQDHGRSVRFFHSYVGFDDEFKLYCEHYPPTLMAGTGYTVVGRFLGVAKWLGFERIDIHGADHALGPNDVAHANGESADEAYTTPMIMSGYVNGKLWRTRADMLVAAVDLVRRIRNTPDLDVRLIGDTLPNALLDKNEDYLEEVCRVLAPDEEIPTGA